MALSNFQFYPQFYPQYSSQQYNSGIIWVQGEAGAKSYLVAPNSTVQLWDSEAPKIYLKSADVSGMPSIRTLKYTIEGEEPVKAAGAGYATPADLEPILMKLDELDKRLSALVEGKE